MIETNGEWLREENRELRNKLAQALEDIDKWKAMVKELSSGLTQARIDLAGLRRSRTFDTRPKHACL